MYGIALAWLYGATDRIPQAIAALDTAIRLDPARPCVYLLRGEFRLSANERVLGMRDLLRTVELEGFASVDPVVDGAILRKIFERDGPEEFLRRLIQLLEERKRSGHWVYSFDLARLHAYAGNRARALNFLELALEERSGILRSSKVIPAFKDLRDEPRFHAILRRLRLEK
jgi:tetratricopeptide (TPR) repeat protein